MEIALKKVPLEYTLNKTRNFIMALKKYKITKKAGRTVAGQRNNGVGTTIEVDEKLGKYEVNQKTLVLVKGEKSEAKPAPASSKDS